MTAARFNPNHAPAGSATGGQFASGGGSSSGAKGGGKKPDAHQQHLAHVAHQQYLANHPDTPGAKAERKKALLEQAHADRVKAAALGKQLKALEGQQAKAAAAARHAHAAAQAAKAGAARRRVLKHHAAVTHRRHASLKARISGLHDQVAALLGKARSLEAEAARL